MVMGLAVANKWKNEKNKNKKAQSNQIKTDFKKIAMLKLKGTNSLFVRVTVRYEGAEETL